jgi:hypothetical protein
MTTIAMLEVTDSDGWTKAFPLQNQLIHIGSDSRNDIVLDTKRGSGVASRHLQLLAISGSPGGYRVVNLSDTAVVLGEAGDRSLAPSSMIEITEGERLHVGDFVLAFYASGVIPADRAARLQRADESPAKIIERTTGVIGLRLALPEVTLGPDRPLEATVSVRNQGQEPGVQIKLEVEGLPPDSYEIGPGPILFPNVEKEVALRLYHPRGPGLPAGRQRIRIRATARAAYPGQSATVSREIEILPFYKHTLHVIPVDRPQA